MKRLVIAGAAGRDFHDYLRLYRDDPETRVVAFTATQIPGIDARRVPPELAGPAYPDGIPIRAEAELEEICRKESVDLVHFAYSDVTHEEVMHLASRALASGADFAMASPERTLLRSRLPVIAVSAVRTGCGKSQTSRWIARRLLERGVAVVALRHPMPYGDLAAQRSQRFASRDDLERSDCTIEEREEYEPYVELGCPIFAGVDYEEILARAEQEAEVVLWDGGNNDFPFVRPDLHVVLADALRPEHVATHHPGEAVARTADVLLVAKSDAASPEQLEAVEARLGALCPGVPILRGASPVTLDDPDAVRGKRAVVVDDGPTLTHGGMRYGAGFVAAMAGGAAEIVDPWPGAAPALRATLALHPHLGRVVPAMGYGAAQCADLRATLDAADADVIVAGTPIDLAALLHPRLPVVRARYAYAEASTPGLGARVDAFLEAHGLGR